MVFNYVNNMDLGQGPSFDQLTKREINARWKAVCNTITTDAQEAIKKRQEICTPADYVKAELRLLRAFGTPINNELLKSVEAHARMLADWDELD